MKQEKKTVKEQIEALKRGQLPIDADEDDVLYDSGFNDAIGKVLAILEADKPVDAGKFAEWCSDNRWYWNKDGKWHYAFEHGTSMPKATYEKNYIKTTEQLITLYKTTKDGQ